jgi:hypothetical protein
VLSKAKALQTLSAMRPPCTGAIPNLDTGEMELEGGASRLVAAANAKAIETAGN